MGIGGSNRWAARAFALACWCGAHAAVAASPAEASSPAPWLRPVMSDADRRHLLARTGIGVTPEDYAALAGLTRAEGVQRVLDGLATGPVRPMPAFTRASLPHYHARDDMSPAERGAFDREREAEVARLRRWWVVEMLDTDSPQTERLVLLLHDLFATSVLGTDRAALAMAHQNATFRRMHSGSWKALLRAMLRDAALLEFLNAASNARDAPNENLARELLERFTLGEGAFAERDVSEAARALTGHGTQDVANLAFRLRTWQQDTGPKTLFGVTGAHDGDDLIELILAQPAAAQWPARIWWHAFVSDADPPRAELDALADTFRRSHLNLGALHRATLESEAFWAPAHRGALVKSPVDVALGLARTLDYPKARVDALPALLAGLGQSPFAPPDVGGWDEGDAWVAPGRLLARYAAAEALAWPDPGASPGGPAQDGMADGMADGMGDGMEARTAADELVLTLASETLDGPARIGVTLLANGAALWDSGVHDLPGGHDTERFGRFDDPATRAWRQHRLRPPASAVANADELRLRFVNDAADVRGDRNVYVDRIALGTRGALAARGVQASGCPPDDPAAAGDLYCAGTLAIAIDAPRAVPDVPPGRATAAALRLRWAEHDPLAGTASATFLLEHLGLPADPAGAYAARTIELLQFRLVGEADGRLDLRIDSYDCRGPCVPRWPACAWRDEREPRTRGLSLTLVPRDARSRRCVTQALEPTGADLFALLEAAAPSFVRAVAGSRAAARRPEAFAAVRARVDAAVAAGLPDRRDAAPVVHASFAPPASAPEAPARASPRTASLDALAAALTPHGTDPVSLLLPGIEGLSVSGDAQTAAERLRATLDHPAFQLH